MPAAREWRCAPTTTRSNCAIDREERVGESRRAEVAGAGFGTGFVGACDGMLDHVPALLVEVGAGVDRTLAIPGRGEDDARVGAGDRDRLLDRRVAGVGAVDDAEDAGERRVLRAPPGVR